MNTHNRQISIETSSSSNGRTFLRNARLAQLCDRHGRCAPPFSLDDPSGPPFVADMIGMGYRAYFVGDILHLVETKAVVPLPAMTGRRA